MEAYKGKPVALRLPNRHAHAPRDHGRKGPARCAKRVAYADGEDERALRAAQLAIDDKIAHPILIGRPAVIAARIEKAGLRMQIGKDVENVNPKTIHASASIGKPTTSS